MAADEPGEWQDWCRECLATLDYRERLKRFMEALGHDNGHIANTAMGRIVAYGKVMPYTVVDLLIDQLANPHLPNRQYILLALVLIGEPAIKPLDEAANRGKISHELVRTIIDGIQVNRHSHVTIPSRIKVPC